MDDDRILASLRAGQTNGPGELTEVDRLRAENEELRTVVAELRQMLDEASARGVQVRSDREKEFESLLEEKSERIRELHLYVQELERRVESADSGGNGGRPAAPPNERELLELSDELERERCQIDQERRQMEEERRQFQEDEEVMTQQMREMEMQMSRERAELARQRNELQRLHNEIRHELELAQRDSLLNERLRLLQRRHQEVSTRQGGEPDRQPSQQPAQEPIAEPPPKKDSGILGNLFGRRR